MSADVISPGIKWQCREIGHSPPFDAEVQNRWSCTFILSAGRYEILTKNVTLFCLAVVLAVTSGAGLLHTGG